VIIARLQTDTVTRTEALDYLGSTMRPAVESQATDTGELAQLLADLAAALSLSE
jgi:hypothetical protein